MSLINLLKWILRVNKIIRFGEKKYAELREKYKDKESEYYKKLAIEKEERKLKESNLKTFIELLKKAKLNLNGWCNI